MTHYLEIKNLTHAYDAQKTFENLSLQIDQGELFCLLGSSGCGKSTLLQCLAGFEQPSGGSVTLDGTDLLNLPPEARGLGLVFQDYALFPHLSVEENIGFALRRSDRQGRDQRVAELLQRIGLPEHGKKYPHELSGGEQQRVAIARSLAHLPRLILFDEPFSNLDPDRRRELRLELRELLRSQGITSIFVTHDQEEAFELADRMAIMGEGSIHQIGSPEDVYNSPATEFVARFVGSRLFLRGKSLGPNSVQSPLGTLALPHSVESERELMIYLPATAIELNAGGPYRALIQDRQFRGALWSYSLWCEELDLRVEGFCCHLDFSVGSEVALGLDQSKLKTVFAL